jgi:thiamine biosynthesis lipoprotein
VCTAIKWKLPAFGVSARRFLTLAVATVFCNGVTAAEPPARFEFTEPQMGVPFKIVVYAADDAAANRAAGAAFRRIEELNSILSDYEDESELNRLSRGSPHAQPVRVSDDLFRVLARSQSLAERTGGAFDVSVGPVVRLWRRARRQRELPTEERLEAALRAVDFRAIKLDPERKTVQLTGPRMRLDLGGIGMGYAVDNGLAVLKEHGIDSAMVDASGDIGVSNPPPGKTGWRIGISPEGPRREPTKFVMLENAALTISGDAYQHVEIDGVRYSHIVDPHTGLGLTNHSAVTVIAKDCTTADSYATAISVLGPKKGLKLAAERPGVEVLIMRVENGQPQHFKSTGFAKYEAQSE